MPEIPTVVPPAAEPLAAHTTLDLGGVTFMDSSGLAALVRPLFAVEPYAGHVFLFRSRSGNYLKALHWDGTGLCLFAKRLERHRFVWPPLVEGGVVLTPAQFALLVEAMDWRRTVAPPAPRLPVQM